MIDELVRKSVLRIQEINWGDIPDSGGARLLWGENPITSKIAVSAIKKEAEKVNYYPSPTKSNLVKELSKYNGVLPDNILPTNGSDEAIELIAKVFIEENDEVIMPIPTFPVYESVSLMMGAKTKTVPLNQDFSLDVKELAKLVNAKTKIIWVANPNNPTGNILLTEGQIENLAKTIKCLIIIDECYFELSKTTAIKLISKYSNIVIIRSFSKVFGMAGARLGYIIADRKVISYLKRVQLANQVFSVNRFAQAGATAILKSKGEIAWLTKEYESQKRIFEKKLSKIKNIEVIPTKTTFCLINIGASGVSSSELKEELAKEKIYIKDCYMYKVLGQNYVYLGVPSVKQQERVVKTLQKILENNNAPKDIDGIIFDLDGVLIDTKNSYRQALKETVNYILKTNYNIDKRIGDDDVAEIKKVPGFNNEWDTSAMLITLISSGTPKSSWNERTKNIGQINRTSRLFKQVFENFQALYLGDQLYKQIYKKNPPINSRGLINNETLLINKEVLEKLKQSGLKIAIATGRPRFEALYALRKTGLIPKLLNETDVIALEDAKEEKPNPAPLLKAKRVVKIKNPIYIGDTINDCVAAERAKMKSVFVGNQNLGDYQINNINNLLGIFKRQL